VSSIYIYLTLGLRINKTAQGGKPEPSCPEMGWVFGISALGAASTAINILPLRNTIVRSFLQCDWLYYRLLVFFNSWTSLHLWNSL
ncbi:hypothetical protein P691DRAFT_803069, partial [Macrolepiota fuliginosa MF-IS2]